MAKRIAKPKANAGKLKKFLVIVPADLVPKLEHMRKVRGLRSRNELLIALCTEATVRENVL